MTVTEAEPSKNAALFKDDKGVAYLKRPYIMSLEQAKALVEEARSRLQVLLKNDVESDDFHSRVTYNRVKVSQKKDGVFCIAKGTTDAPQGMTLTQVREQFQSDFRNNEVLARVYTRIDPMNLQMTIVSSLQHPELLDETKHEQLRVLWAAFYVAPLISDRDFVFVQHTLETTCPSTGQPIFVSNSFSVELPEAAPDMEQTLGRVRASIQLTGYVFRPHPTLPNRLTMSYMGQADPKGSLPVTVVNMASISQALNAGRVRDIYEHLCAVQKELPGAQFPFDSYNLHRRGGACYHTVPLVPPEERAKIFYVRLCVHSEHDIAVLVEAAADGSYQLSGGNDEVGEDLATGKTVRFGGGKVLDAVLQVTLEDGAATDKTPDLILQFTNSGWRQTILTLPVNMPISMTHPTVSAASIALTAQQ